MHGQAYQLPPRKRTEKKRSDVDLPRRCLTFTRVKKKLPIAWLAATIACASAQGQTNVFTNLLSRIAFGSGLDPNTPQPIWSAVVAAQPQLFLFAGDVVCADTTNLAAKEVAYRAQAAQPGFQMIEHTCPLWATWDDLDYGTNDSGAEFTGREESQELFLDFFGESDASPRRHRPGVYDSRVYGPPGEQVQIILLDTRFFRGPLRPRENPLPGDGPWEPSTNRATTLLGEDQWTWFRQQLRVPAQVRLIVSSIQVIAEDHGWEKWANLPAERKLLFTMISDTEADGVLFLSGDRRHAELSMLDAGVGYPLYDLTSSGLNTQRDVPVTEINRHGVSPIFAGHNFGQIAIDWSQTDPLLTLEILDERGEPQIQHTVRLSALQVRTDNGP